MKKRGARGGRASVAEARSDARPSIIPQPVSGNIVKVATPRHAHTPTGTHEHTERRTHSYTGVFSKPKFPLIHSTHARTGYSLRVACKPHPLPPLLSSPIPHCPSLPFPPSLCKRFSSITIIRPSIDSITAKKPISLSLSTPALAPPAFASAQSPDPGSPLITIISLSRSYL